MEKAKPIPIPIIADQVLSPEVLYSDEQTALYFETEDEEFGRITFENLDALQVCRGEYLPYACTDEDNYTLWVYKIENSQWLKSRFAYEKENYAHSYEFAGDVMEMLTDYKHYLFRFHDQFVEVLAKGFWFEKDTASLFKKKLQAHHPFLNLEKHQPENYEAHGLKCTLIKNNQPIEQLKMNAQFCSQILLQLTLELDEQISLCHTLFLFKRNGQWKTRLTNQFGNKTVFFDHIATFKDIQPHIDQYLLEVKQRRNAR